MDDAATLSTRSAVSSTDTPLSYVCICAVVKRDSPSSVLLYNYNYDDTNPTALCVFHPTSVLLIPVPNLLEMEKGTNGSKQAVKM